MKAENLSILAVDCDQDSLLQIEKLFQSIPTISEVLTATDTNEAILKIINNSPDIILISYPPNGNTEKELFELAKTKLPDSSIAFISDTKDYAKTAIQNGVYKYILRPLTEKTAKELTKSALEKKQSNMQNRLDKVIGSNPSEVRLRFLTNSGYLIFNPEELLLGRSSGCHTELCLTNNKQEISHLSLIRFEEIMVPLGFIRVSRTHLINPRYIKRIIKKENILTLASNGFEYDIKVAKNYIKKLSNFDLE